MDDPRDPRGRPSANALLLAAFIGLILWMIAAAVFAQAPAASPLDRERALTDSQRAIGRMLSAHRLRDEDGSPVDLARYRGKPLLVSFIYTGCFAACPIATQFLGKAVGEAQRALGAGTFHVVTVGFNAPFDSPAAMRDFHRRHAPGASGWSFLSGDEAAVQALAREVGFAWAPTAAGFDHLAQVTLVDADGRIVEQVYGETFELPLLINPLKGLVLGNAWEPTDWRALAEKVRLLCTVYDARSGGYRLNYALFIEIFAGLTVLFGILFYLGREMRRHRAARLRAPVRGGPSARVA
jgi:protein SCO1/2